MGKIIEGCSSKRKKGLQPGFDEKFPLLRRKFTGPNNTFLPL